MAGFAELRDADPGRAEGAATAWDNLSKNHETAGAELRRIFVDPDLDWSGDAYDAAVAHVDALRSRMLVAQGSAKMIADNLRHYAGQLRGLKHQLADLTRQIAAQSLAVSDAGQVSVPFFIAPDRVDEATRAQQGFQQRIDDLVAQAESLDRETGRQLHDYSSPSQAILHKYQVIDDSGQTTLGLLITVNQSEWDQLAATGSPYFRANDVDNLRDETVAATHQRFSGNDADHTMGNAFQHAYGNALMERRFGDGFAQGFGTAHERHHGNPGPNEAMDLYNNELGRRIARENPNLSDAQLADRIEAAVRDGGGAVVDKSAQVRYADQVPAGQTIGDAAMRKQPTVDGQLPGDVGFDHP